MRFVLLFLFVLRLNSAWGVWVDFSSNNAPEARTLHTAVWTGQEMIVWGGFDGSKTLNRGGIYNPQTDTWRGMNTEKSSQSRGASSAIWTGQEMIIWGGHYTPDQPLNSGGIYNPVTDQWKLVSLTHAPEPRSNHTAVWTGQEMIVWSGEQSGRPLRNGGNYKLSK